MLLKSAIFRCENSNSPNLGLPLLLCLLASRSIPMAGGGSFFHRVVQYVANELIVDRLANSPSFQRFAVRSAKAMEELAEKGAQKRAELLDQARGLTKTLQEEVGRNLKDVNKRQ